MNVISGAKTSNKDSYQEFNKFQTLFFTDKNRFENYTNFEVKKFGYILINNIAKGFPVLANIISNLKGIDWSGVTSPGLIKALQCKFVNNYANNSRVPQFVYLKNLKPEKDTSKIKVSKKSSKLFDFDSEIKAQICSILMYDSKTYEYLKYSDKVQYLGKQLHSEYINQMSQAKKTTKSKSKK